MSSNRLLENEERNKPTEFAGGNCYYGHGKLVVCSRVKNSVTIA